MEATELIILWKQILLSVILGGFVLLVGYLWSILVLKQNRLRRRLESQGIRGPTPSFLLGNIPEMKRIQLQFHSKQQQQQQQQHDAKLAEPEDHHHHHQDQLGVALSHDWPSSIFPYFNQWRNEYGPIFMYSTGNIQMIFISDPEIVKEMSLCMSLGLGKPSYLTKDRGPLLGQGVVSSSGPSWAHQRKIISPEFYPDKVKGMVNLMVDSTHSLLRSWEQRIDNEGGIADITVDDDLRNLSGDIISRACFGSSYSQGKEIFSMLRTLQGIMSKSSLFIGIPGLRHVPSKNNREIWRLEKKIHSMILKVVDQRTEAIHEKDLLQMILEAAKNYGGDSADSMASDMIKRDKFIVDNCKSIYFAGHETTATTATWTLLLLAAHPDWQARVRAEVQELFGDRHLPDADTVRSMKILTMVLQETLRLYPPAAFITREAYKDLKFKDVLLPKGVNVSIPVPILHQDPDLWGPDVHKFNPERFAGGILGACKSPQAYIPFGMGTRLCLGQHFGMVELKVVLSLILSKFCFSISPTYRHSPAFKLVIERSQSPCEKTLKALLFCEYKTMSCFIV